MNAPVLTASPDSLAYILYQSSMDFHQTVIKGWSINFHQQIVAENAIFVN